MTLQQLRYLIAVAEYGSINKAAACLYASQSNLSTAIKDLERELGITIFTRNNRGVALTNDGAELVSYARQVLEQVEMIEDRYSPAQQSHARLAISTQHYAFSLQAFMEVADRFAGDEYDFILRETTTAQIISDVSTFRSDAGVLYLDNFNERVLTKALEDAHLSFTPLFSARTHVFLSEKHPLANRDVLRLEDLEGFPRYSFEQGPSASLYFAEEPLSYLPHPKNIRITDRGTLTNLLTNHSGYTLSTGVLSEEMHSGIASIPLEDEITMTVGYVMHTQRKPSELLRAYLGVLENVIRENPSVQSQ
ncbi:MAG: LysR family transcriptional regulator [Eggerthellaceae bacterium]|nr:LysR family transcriptional regulator [Eggerthellaceae bacterium]